MNMDFAVFCVTCIIIAAIALGRDKPAENAVKALADVTDGLGDALRGVLRRLPVK